MLYPLRFTPRLVEKMWGGRKLQTILGKRLPPDKPIGESWELYDFPPGVVEASQDWVSSVITNGPHAGKTLHWAMSQFRADLLGDAKPVGPHGQFPVLIKFLDARDDLSVQVHPDPTYSQANPGAHLKTEAWYILQHDPGARLFKGLRPEANRDNFRTAIERGNVERLLGTIDAKVGDCHYLPSGTVHALGAGILVAEVQTPSDTTFRVFDFNRVDPSTGETRALHVEQAMQCIDFTPAPKATSPAPASRASRSPVMPLAESPYFEIEKVSLRAGGRLIHHARPVVLIMLEGEAHVSAKGANESVSCRPGEVVLLPAVVDGVIEARGACAWLQVTFPTDGATNANRSPTMPHQ